MKEKFIPIGWKTNNQVVKGENISILPITDNNFTVNTGNTIFKLINKNGDENKLITTK